MVRQAVQINSGPIEATDQLREVPREKWHDLMLARRYFLEVHLSHDCRCLVEFVNDAAAMYSALGFQNTEDMIRNGYRLEPEEIAVAVEWLRLNPPDEPVSLDGVKALAAKNQAIDAEDRANPPQPGRRTDLVDTTSEGVNEVRRPTGNAAAAGIRRLRKDRPDIHARVLAGELTANAGMVEAGFRKKRASKRQSALEKIQKLLPLLNEAECKHLVAQLNEIIQGRLL